jgi:hypothetical protein
LRIPENVDVAELGRVVAQVALQKRKPRVFLHT